MVAVRSHRFERFTSLVFAAGTGTVLALSAWLTPDPSGHSTHLQLGLNPCTFMQLTSVPCPMCGATTSFTLMAHGQPLQALVTQPFAALLFVLTTIVFGVSLAEVLAPRQRWSRILGWLAPYELKLAVLFLAGMGAGWIYKILVMTL